MNSLQSLTDQELVNHLYQTAKEERKITAQVIELLREFEYRKLYLKKGFGSLLDYCVKELKYSESSAYRRISAMRLSYDIPQVRDKIIEGTLSLSVISQVQTFIRQEEKSSGEKLKSDAKIELLSELENKSSREAEQILIAKSPEQIRPEKLRSLTSTQSELRLTLDEVTLKKLEKIKSLISHKNPNPTFAELIEVMAELTLEKLDPENEKRKRKATPTRKNGATKVATTSKYISVLTKREVWKKSRGQCCYRDPQTKRRCDSRFQLQIDHIIPISQNGPSTISNLQLFCRQHNQLKGYRI
jgi:hypothetical protein